MTKKKSYKFKEENEIATIHFQTTNKRWIDKIAKAFNQACEKIRREKEMDYKEFRKERLKIKDPSKNHEQWEKETRRLYDAFKDQVEKGIWTWEAIKFTMNVQTDVFLQEEEGEKDFESFNR